MVTLDAGAQTMCRNDHVTCIAGVALSMIPRVSHADEEQ